LIGLVAFSRTYLGVHFPQDVIAGLGIGALYLVVWLWAEPRVRSWLRTLAVGWRYAIAVAAPLAMLVVHVSEDTTAAMGALVGLGTGYVLEGQTLRFAVAGAWRQRVLRGALGLALTVAAFFGLRALFGLLHVEGVVALGVRIFRYALIGFVGGWGVPWVFVQSGLSERDT
jgi:hypothetical protein